MYSKPGLDITVWFLLSFVGSLLGSSPQHQLNITIFMNEPHIYHQNGTYHGALPELLNTFNRYYGRSCGPRGLVINYGPMAATYPEFLDAAQTTRHVTSGSTIVAFAPVLATQFDHSIVGKFTMRPILYSPGYTLVARSLTQTKIYRLIEFGFVESVTLLVVLILGIVTIGSIVWFLERDKSAENPNFSYHVIPGVWDGFWWAAVTISTVGYGDKVPKTFLGRAVGVLWLFFACTLLASFGAIMTSSVTTETVSISGKKISYLEHTTAKDIIISNAALPVGTKTPQEAWEMARKGEVYGAMLDTNYVTHMQDELHDKGVLIDQRFHGSEQHTIRIWIKKPLGNSSMIGNNSCLETLTSYFNSTMDKLKFLQPMLKKNRHTTVAERLKPNSFSNHGLLISYCFCGCVVAIWIIIGVTDYLIERKAKKVSTAELVPMKDKSKEELLAKLCSRVEDLCSEISDIKSMIQTIETHPTKWKEQTEAKNQPLVAFVSKI